MSRFDNRSKDQFKKDIYFGTMLEEYFFKKFVASQKRNDVYIDNIRDNGIGNDGEYIEAGVNTSGADYMVDMGEDIDLPLEIKWVPTYGKFTLKVNDLKSYIKEKAAILFIYTTKFLPLKKPRDHNLLAHTQLIDYHERDLRWGIMYPDDVERFLKSNKDKIKPIPYMGGKPGIVLPQANFSDWFTQETF